MTDPMNLPARSGQPAAISLSCRTVARQIGSAAACLCLAAAANAQSDCDAEFLFDGSLSASGDTTAVSMLDREEMPVRPEFTEGIRGEALKLNGAGVMIADLDLHYDACPQLTVTAWVRIDPGATDPGGYLFSVGANGPAGLSVVDRDVVLRGGGNGIEFPRGLRDSRVWFFVAGVYDFEKRTYRLQFRNRVMNHTLPERLREPERQVFVGARDRRLFSAAQDIVIDELRVFGRALDQAELGRIAADVTGQPWLTAVAHGAVRVGQGPGGLNIPSGTGVTRLPIGPSVMPGSAGIPGVDEPASEPGPHELLDAEPIAAGGPDTDLTAPSDLPVVGDVPDTPPPPARIDVIECDGSTGVQPTVWRKGAFPAEFVSAVAKARECGLSLKVATINEQQQWIVATDSQLAHSTDVPPQLGAQLRAFESSYGGLDAADIGEDGGWALVAGNVAAHGGLTSRTGSQIEQIVAAGSQVVALDFFPGDSSRWIAISANGGVTESGIGTSLKEALPNRTLSQRQVHQARLTRDGWLLLGTDYWHATQNVDRQTLDVLQTHQQSGLRLDHVVFGATSEAYLTYSTGPEPQRSGDPIYFIEHSLSRSTIWSRMENFDLPAVSIAVVRNNEIAWARAYGIRNADEPESYANIETTFDAASISKPIAAFGLLQLVQAGELSLTEEGVLNDLEPLFDEDEWTRFEDAMDPDTGNLIQLLQHCMDISYVGGTGCSGGAFEYPTGRVVPGTGEIMLGDDPQNSCSELQRGANSGGASSYSSANFLPVQALIDVHGGGFLNHMEPLLRDLGMNKATYRSPYPQRNAGNFARGWDGTTMTPLVAYGEMAAASLVARPMDVARFAIAVNEIRGNPNAVQPLSAANVARFLGSDSSIYTSSDFSVCADANTYNSRGVDNGDWGLGVRVGSRALSGLTYIHGGTHNGYRTRMIAYPDMQTAIVVFMNSDERPGLRQPMNADVFFNELFSAFVSAYRL